MIFRFRVHESWTTVPHALARILTTLAALERPRQPGDDGEDLALLLDGVDTPEPQPAAVPAARPAVPPASRPVATPSPAAAPPAREWDGVPRTGRGLYKWACDRKALPKVNAIGKLHGYARRITDWADHEVAAAYAILTATAEPIPNGTGRATP
jgi:hypothetical protein